MLAWPSGEFRGSLSCPRTFDMWTRGAGDWTTNHVISGQTTLHPETQPPLYSYFYIIFSHYAVHTHFPHTPPTLADSPPASCRTRYESHLLFRQRWSLFENYSPLAAQQDRTDSCQHRRRKHKTKSRSHFAVGYMQSTGWLASAGDPLNCTYFE